MVASGGFSISLYKTGVIAKNSDTMGFLDKMKAAAKNVDSKAGEEMDKSKVKGKISEEKREIENLLKKIGTAYYDAFEEGKEVTEDLDAMCKEIDDRKKKIEEYEEEIKAIEEAGKKEREQNNAEAEAAAQARAEAKAAAKAEAEAAKEAENKE